MTTSIDLTLQQVDVVLDSLLMRMEQERDEFEDAKVFAEHANVRRAREQIDYGISCIRGIKDIADIMEEFLRVRSSLLEDRKNVSKVRASMQRLKEESQKPENNEEMSNPIRKRT